MFKVYFTFFVRCQGVHSGHIHRHGTDGGILGFENAGRLEVRAHGLSIKVLSYPYLHNAFNKLGYFDIF